MTGMIGRDHGRNQRMRSDVVLPALVWWISAARAHVPKDQVRGRDVCVKNIRGSFAGWSVGRDCR